MEGAALNGQDVMEPNGSPTYPTETPRAAARGADPVRGVRGRAEDQAVGQGPACRILKLVLFGSYARGDWVEDRSSGYLSDYDLLVVVNDARFAEQYEAWEKAEERLLQELTWAVDWRRR